MLLFSTKDQKFNGQWFFLSNCPNDRLLFVLKKIKKKQTKGDSSVHEKPKKYTNKNNKNKDQLDILIYIINDKI